MTVVVLTKERQEEIRGLRSYAEAACGDMAYDAAKSGWGHEEIISRLKKRGITDIVGALADEFYNDIDTMSDLLGDQLSDLMHKWGWRYNKGQNAVWNEAVVILANDMSHIKEGLIKTLQYEVN